MKWSLLFIMFLASCSEEKEYKVIISKMHPETKATRDEVLMIKADGDTAAFQQGCKEYWLKKSVALEMNKKFEGTSGFIYELVPFYFSVETKEGSVIVFPSDVAERITAQTVNYYKEKVIPAIDTITPFAKRPKEESAKIY